LALGGPLATLTSLIHLCRGSRGDGGRTLLRDGPQCLALHGDGDPCAAGHVQTASWLVACRLPLILEAVADMLWQPRQRAVPVDLEPFGVPHVQVVRGDEGQPLSVGIRAEAADDDGVEAGLRMRQEPLRVCDFEGVGRVCRDWHGSFLGSRFWVGNHSPSVYSLYQASTTIAREFRSAGDL